MKYYIVTIEQINAEGGYSEYGKVEKVDTEEMALSKFYKKLSDVSADLGKAHTYMDIKIFNSEGGCIKRDAVGAYQTEQPTPEPEPEEAEE